MRYTGKLKLLALVLLIISATAGVVACDNHASIGGFADLFACAH